MKLFDSVKMMRPKSNKFDLSHEKKMSLNMGDLIPILVQEVLPGDKFRCSSEVMMRLAPMLAPVMHRFDVYVHYFLVPNRLIWTEWEDFITGGREGTAAPVAPFITTGNEDAATLGMFDVGTLADYLGLPTIPIGTLPTYQRNISALPFRAYQLIWNEYFRDQNLSAPIDFSKGSGEQAGSEIAKIMSLRKRAWEKDYFTSCLPWAQRGPEVLMPFSADVEYKDVSEIKTAAGAAAGTGAISSGSGDLQVPGGPTGRIENIESIENGTTTINNLRVAVKIQEWLEKNARGGARYIEQILSHFGVMSSDARLQRPEYLGGGKQPIIVSEVVSTFQDDTSEPQANMAGHGISIGKSNTFSKRFEEHGFVIGLMSVRPRTTYQQGIPRMFLRDDKFKYYWPEFANIGEQEVEADEVFYNTAAAPTIPTFGYQSRYAEYKYGNSTVHGDMKTSLAFWHDGRIFETPPVLNADFVTCNPSQRIFAVEDATVHKLYAQVYNKIDAIRPMPYYGVPTL